MQRSTVNLEHFCQKLSAVSFHSPTEISNSATDMSKVVPSEKPVASPPPKTQSFFSEWCHVTGWHGVIDFYLTKNLFAKSLWLALLLLSCFFAINQSASLVLDFFSDNQWVTSISYEMPDDGGLPWPNMSVCSLDLMDAAKLRKRPAPTNPYLVAYIAQPFVDEAFTFYDQYQADNPSTGINESIAQKEENISLIYMNGLDKRNTSLTKVMEKYVRLCNDTVLHCGHSDQFYLHKEASTCCQGSRLASWNQCFTILPENSVQKSYRNTGFDSAVYYLFNPRIYDYYRYILENSKPSGGLRLHLYFGSEEEASLSTILLTPGTHTLVSMVPEKYRTITRRLRTVQLYPITETCREKPEYEFVESVSNIYSRRYCHTDCEAAWSMHNCGCVIADVPLKKGTLCKGKQLADCIYSQRDSYRQNESTIPNGFNMASCMEKCIDACKHDAVSIKASVALFPAPAKLEAFATYINRAFNETEAPFTLDQLKQLILFEMFYETREYKVIERVTRISTEELISNIGGSLGVWTGISFLSIFEAVVYLSRSAIAACRRVCKRRDVRL